MTEFRVWENNNVDDNLMHLIQSIQRYVSAESFIVIFMYLCRYLVYIIGDMILLLRTKEKLV